MTAEGSLTLDRGLALLQAVADAGGEAATISELATRIGASRAAVYRLLVPLGERGLVRRDRRTQDARVVDGQQHRRRLRLAFRPPRAPWHRLAAQYGEPGLDGHIA